MKTCCVYSLEAPQGIGSNENLQQTFLWEKKLKHQHFSVETGVLSGAILSELTIAVSLDIGVPPIMFRALADLVGKLGIITVSEKKKKKKKLFRTC